MSSKEHALHLTAMCMCAMVHLPVVRPTGLCVCGEFLLSLQDILHFLWPRGTVLISAYKLLISSLCLLFFVQYVASCPMISL